MSLDLRWSGHRGAESDFIGGGGGGAVLRKEIRIKEFNPRLIYFHYLQD